MESDKTQTTTYQRNSFEFADNFNDSHDAETRLNSLLAIQRENERDHTLYKNEEERFAASLIKNPITTDKAFAQFGLMLGTFPPMALFGKFLANAQPNSDNYWVIPLLIFVNFVCGGVGYFSGKLIGKMVAETEKWSWGGMLLTLPFIGILWGLLAGGAGGIFIFVIGAIFGAILAAMVGGVAVPTFTIFHRLLKKGDVIERDQFLPIALGITLIISAIFLGLNFK